MEHRLVLPAGDTEEQRKPGAGKGQAKRKSTGRRAHTALGNSPSCHFNNPPMESRGFRLLLHQNNLSEVLFEVR